MKKHLAVLVVLFVLGAYYAPLLHGQPDPTQPPASPITNVPGTVAPAAQGVPTQPAVAVTTVPSPVSPQNPLDQVMWALAMSFGMRFITKKGWFAFLTPTSTARIKTLCGFLIAAGTAAGIHLAVNGSPFDGHGASITITGLSFDAFKDVGFQWVSQQAWYDGLVKRTI